MPTYDYRCNKCRRRFTLRMSLQERDQKVVKCPKCKSSKVSQQIGSFYAKTSKKS